MTDIEYIRKLYTEWRDAPVASVVAAANAMFLAPYVADLLDELDRLRQAPPLPQRVPGAAIDPARQVILSPHDCPLCSDDLVSVTE